MKVFLICSLILLSGCWGLMNNLMTQHIGDSLIVSCVYHQKYRNSGKCWCKAEQKQCNILVQTTRVTRHVEGRVSIRDSERERKITVTMEKLTKEDGGNYLCGITEKNECRYMHSFRVNVLSDTSSFTESIVTKNSSEEEGTTVSTHLGASTALKKTFPTQSPAPIMALHVLIPVLLLLLFLVFLAVVILVRTHRKKKQALVKETATGYENAAFTHSPRRKVMATTVYVTAGPPASAESKPPLGDSKPEPYYEEIQELHPEAHGRTDEAFYCTVGYPVQVQH